MPPGARTIDLCRARTRNPDIALSTDSALGYHAIGSIRHRG